MASYKILRLSIIVPVYNEKSTFSKLMDQLLAKKIPDIEFEIIIVESNSTDGSREVAKHYARHPAVILMLEEKPLGKGHAVRAGFKKATGDFILIQDADLEYSLDDYEILLEPLIQRRVDFVLGSRHAPHRGSKIREFENNRWMALLLNGGHLFFTELFNILYQQNLKDPFTMYKVFRRECIQGLQFECNRFDFDWELLCKLVRKGIYPLEIPVSYRSRSFSEGKKVTLIKDPLLWLRAAFKYRF